MQLLPQPATLIHELLSLYHVVYYHSTLIDHYEFWFHTCIAVELCGSFSFAFKQFCFSTLEINNVTSHWPLTSLYPITVLSSVALHIASLQHSQVTALDLFHLFLFCLTSVYLIAMRFVIVMSCLLVLFLLDRVCPFLSMFVMVCRKLWKTHLSGSCSVTLHRLLQSSKPVIYTPRQIFLQSIHKLFRSLKFHQFLSILSFLIFFCNLLQSVWVSSKCYSSTVHIVIVSKFQRLVVFDLHLRADHLSMHRCTTGAVHLCFPVLPITSSSSDSPLCSSITLSYRIVSMGYLLRST